MKGLAGVIQILIMEKRRRHQYLKLNLFHFNTRVLLILKIVLMHSALHSLLFAAGAVYFCRMGLAGRRFRLS